MKENFFWVNLLFCFTILVHVLFFWWNVKSIKSIHYRAAIGFLTWISIAGNIFFLWHTWSGIIVYGLHPREVLMYWLAYPEYSFPIQIGLLLLVYVMVPHKNFRFRSIVSMNLVFLISLAFQIRILIIGLPVDSPKEYVNVYYQAQHAAFVGSVFIFTFILLQWVMGRRRAE